MGYKKVCTTCRLCFSRPHDLGTAPIYLCPTCSKPMLLLTHRFRAPAKQADQKWKVVCFLIDHGFLYQPIYKVKDGQYTKEKVKYPETLMDARVFVKDYRAQALPK